MGIPHRITDPADVMDGFVQKVVNLCRMLHGQGHQVIHLGVEGSRVQCSEHVDVVTRDHWEEVCGKDEGTWAKNQLAGVPYQKYQTEWAKNATAAIKDRTGKPLESVVCMTWGDCQRGVDVNGQFCVEAGIGYVHAWAPWRIYESYAWLHYHLGQDKRMEDPPYYWPVIPVAYDMKMFDFNAKRGEDFLYIGRLQESKGVREAVETARLTGRRITITGPGDPKPFLAKHVDYLPPVGFEDWRRLLATCRALFCPSRYVEPFGRTPIEAMASGAPVISTDWGGHTEHVLQGVTGYRCRTMDDYVWAANNIDRIDPATCRDWARKNFDVHTIAPMYTQYFESLMGSGVQKPDWNFVNPGRNYPPIG